MNAFRKFDTDNNGTISRDELREALKAHANIEDDIEGVSFVLQYVFQNRVFRSWMMLTKTKMVRLISKSSG